MFAMFGLFFITVFIFFPIADALNFGICMTILHWLSPDWKRIKAHPIKVLKWTIKYPFKKAISRLIGDDSYTTSVDCGNWSYTVPFTFRKNK